jgi:NDP-sugar pyrophosphorylase family protein
MLEIGGMTLLSRLIRTLEPLVPRIHVVVGYREEMVIELCAREHRNIVIVRNPAYRSTNTAESMSMGARACQGKTLFLDGDLLIEPRSLRAFIAEASRHDLLMGVSATRSEQPVCVELAEHGQADGELRLVSGFTRDARFPFEWANVVAGPPRLMDGVSGYVFERLRERAPLPALPIELREVDTLADLEMANEFARAVLHRADPNPVG